MFTGRANKAGGWDENEDSLSQMIDLFGPIPQDLLDKGSRTPKYYDDKGMS